MNKRITIVKGISQVLFSIVLFSTFLQSTFAQTIEFNLYPTIIEIESEPGQRIEHQIIAKGTTGGSYTFKAYALEVTGNQGHFISSKKKTDFLQWISFVPNTITFDAYHEKKIGLVVDIPQDTKLGDYYLTISLERDFGDEKEGTVLSGSLEIPLLITVMREGQPSLEGYIKKFKTVYLDFFNPITFDVEIENPGLRKLKSFGKIEITNKLTKENYSKELIPQNVLAESTRIAVDEEGFVQGNNYISWVSPNIFGIYSARVDLYDKYHEQENAQILDSSKELTFIYMDFFLLLGVCMSLVLTFLIFYFNRKSKII